MVDELEDLGYSVHARAGDESVRCPAFRQRLFLVGLRNGADFAWPESGGHVVSVKSAIGDLPSVLAGSLPEGGAEGWWPYPAPITTFQQRARAGVPGDQQSRVYDHITRPVRDDDLVAFQGMDSKTRYSDLAPELRRYRSDMFDDKYKRLDADARRAR